MHSNIIHLSFLGIHFVHAAMAPRGRARSVQTRQSEPQHERPPAVHPKFVLWFVVALTDTLRSFLPFSPYRTPSIAAQTRHLPGPSARLGSRAHCRRQREILGVCVSNSYASLLPVDFAFLLFHPPSLYQLPSPLALARVPYTSAVYCHITCKSSYGSL